MRKDAVLWILVLAAVAALGIASTSNAVDSELQLTVTGVQASVSTDPVGRLTGCVANRCSYKFPVGATVTVTATPTGTSGSFARWRGACSGATPVCTVVLDRNQALTARFTPVQLFADLTERGGSIKVSPEGSSCGFRCWSYPYASRATISAMPQPGYAFDGWGGRCAAVGVPSCTVNLFGGVDTWAMFRCTGAVCRSSQPVTHKVATKVVVRGPGYVTLGGRKCWSTCKYRFKRGRALSAHAHRQDSSFTGWSGGWCTGSSLLCQFTAFRDAFERPPKLRADFTRP
jgi:hypothetical protein